MIATERGVQLYERVIAPLLLGGDLRPVRPVGPTLAAHLAKHSAVAPALASQVDDMRARRARQWARVDSLPPLTCAEWMLAAALNDLTQATNPHLQSAFARVRTKKLLAATNETLAHVPSPSTLLDVLSRHALLAPVMQISRVDTAVHWWTGNAMFCGEAPPARLLAWPKLRRVTVQQKRVPLALLGDELTPRDGAFLEALGVLLSKSPLTDLATAARTAPAFYWSAGVLTLLATPAGARLARRAMGPLTVEHDSVFARAEKPLAKRAPELARMATDFLTEARALADARP